MVFSRTAEFVAGLWVNSSDTSNNLDRDKAQWNKAIPFTKGNTMPKTRHNRTSQRAGKRLSQREGKRVSHWRKGFPLKRKSQRKREGKTFAKIKKKERQK